MTQREKLIDLLETIVLPRKEIYSVAEIADFMIDFGVIALPCKVGDTVFCIRKNPYAKGRYVKENEVLRVSFCVDGYISITSTKEDLLGRTVFLTREEAEAALKKMEGEK